MKSTVNIFALEYNFSKYRSSMVFSYSHNRNTSALPVKETEAQESTKEVHYGVKTSDSDLWSIAMIEQRSN